MSNQAGDPAFRSLDVRGWIPLFFGKEMDRNTSCTQKGGISIQARSSLISRVRHGGTSRKMFQMTIPQKSRSTTANQIIVK
jgi:hypothetical protein